MLHTTHCTTTHPTKNQPPSNPPIQPPHYPPYRHAPLLDKTSPACRCRHHGMKSHNLRIRPIPPVCRYTQATMSMESNKTNTCKTTRGHAQPPTLLGGVRSYYLGKHQCMYASTHPCSTQCAPVRLVIQRLPQHVHLARKVLQKQPLHPPHRVPLFAHGSVYNVRRLQCHGIHIQVHHCGIAGLVVLKCLWSHAEQCRHAKAARVDIVGEIHGQFSPQDMIRVVDFRVEGWSQVLGDAGDVDHCIGVAGQEPCGVHPSFCLGFFCLLLDAESMINDEDTLLTKPGEPQPWRGRGGGCGRNGKIPFQGGSIIVVAYRDFVWVRAISIQASGWVHWNAQRPGLQGSSPNPLFPTG